MSLSQQVLVLRQVAALRRAGLPHDQAVRAATEGLPPGALKRRAQVALAALHAGVPDATGDDLARTLSTPGPVSTLDLAALAAEAQLDAQEAVATSRRLLTLMLAGGALLPCCAAWAEHLLAAAAGFDELRGAGAITSALLRFGGPLVAALGAALGYRLGAHLAPGRTQLEAAIALLQAPESPLRREVDQNTRRYLALRRAAGPPQRAAQEVVDELVLDAREQLATFRLVGPMVAAAGVAAAALLVLAPALLRLAAVARTLGGT
jgi:hypothetical protein